MEGCGKDPRRQWWGTILTPQYSLTQANTGLEWATSQGWGNRSSKIEEWAGLLKL